jgi:hypothetical protein
MAWLAQAACSWCVPRETMERAPLDAKNTDRVEMLSFFGRASALKARAWTAEAASIETGPHNLPVETGENGVKMNENERDFALN